MESVLKENNTKPKLVFYVILITCLFLTALISFHFKKEFEEKQRFRVNSLVREVKSALKERMADYIDAHYAGVGLFQSSINVQRNEWRTFVKSINLIKRYPGINGLGYSAQVEHEDKEEFIAKIRKDAFPNFYIKPPGIRKNYFTIPLIEPIEQNLPALGFDMGSEANRRNAMERARDTAKPAITKKIILVQDSGKTPGFLSYVPFYSKDNLKDLEDRQANFRGWIYAPFIVKDFIRGLLDTELAEIKNSIAMKIYDDSSLNDKNLIYLDDCFDEFLERKSLEKTFKVDFYGETWTVKLLINSSFSRIFEGENDYIYAIILGLILTALLVYLFSTLSNTRDKAIKLARVMTEELNHKNIELEKTNNDLQAFAYIASHDLKEPLRTINGYTELISLKLKKEGLLSDPKIDKYTNYISSATKRLQALINDLLVYSKLGQNTIKFEEVNTQNVVNSAKDLLEAMIEEKNAEIKVQNQLPIVSGSEGQLSRVFQNLISNSIKYCKEKPVIIISCDDLGDSYKFIVEDNGIGIAEEYQEQIFKLFSRLHSIDEFSGTGLGLSICKKIIEAHGGKIWVESEPGKGSKFIFTIKK